MTMQSKIQAFAVTLDRDALLSNLGAVARITEKRNSIPILSNVLTQASPKAGLTFLTTDLDVTLSRPVAASATAYGALTVPVHVFLKLAKGLPPGNVTLTESEGALLVEGGRKRFTLATLAADDYPRDPQGKTVCQFQITSPVLRDMLERTQFAISTEETRYYLNGVFLTVREQGKTLSAVATDGHHLARISIPGSENAETLGDKHNGAQGLIIPRKSVRELIVALKGMTGAVDVAHDTGSAQRVHFVTDAWAISTKIIDGNYPDSERVIPAAGQGNPLTFNVAAFMAALEGVSAIAERGRGATKLTVTRDAVKLTVHNPEVGSASETVDALHLGDDVEIGFNAPHLREILSEITGETATIEISDLGSPVRITDSADASVLFVLMPIRV